MEKRGVGFRQEAKAEPSRVLFGAHELLRGGDAGRSLTYRCGSAAQQIYKGEHRQRRHGILLKDTPLQEEGCHGVETTIQSIGVKITILMTTSFNLSALAFMSMSSLVAQMVKNLPVIWKTRVQSLGWEDPLEKGMTTHSSILAWRIPWAEEPGRLQSMGLQRVGHDWVANTKGGKQKGSKPSGEPGSVILLSQRPLCG